MFRTALFRRCTNVYIASHVQRAIRFHSTESKSVDSTSASSGISLEHVFDEVLSASKLGAQLKSEVIETVENPHFQQELLSPTNRAQVVLAMSKILKSSDPTGALQMLYNHGLLSSVFIRSNIRTRNTAAFINAKRQQSDESNTQSSAASAVEGNTTTDAAKTSPMYPFKTIQWESPERFQSCIKMIQTALRNSEKAKFNEEQRLLMTLSCITWTLMPRSSLDYVHTVLGFTKSILTHSLHISEEMCSQVATIISAAHHLHKLINELNAATTTATTETSNTNSTQQQPKKLQQSVIPIELVKQSSIPFRFWVRNQGKKRWREACILAQAAAAASVGGAAADAATSALKRMSGSLMAIFVSELKKRAALPALQCKPLLSGKEAARITEIPIHKINSVLMKLILWQLSHENNDQLTKQQATDWLLANKHSLLPVMK